MGEVVRAHGRDKSRLKVKTQHKPVVKVPVQHQQEKKLVHRQEESIEEVRTYVRTHVGVQCRGDVRTNARGRAVSRWSDSVALWTVVKNRSDIYVVLVEHKKKSFSCGSCDTRELVHLVKRYGLLR